MNTVVEVGCGDFPGPFFEGASEHYAFDKDPDLIRAAKTHALDLTLQVGDATNLDIESESVGTILARNVFGDPYFGIDERTKWMARQVEAAAIADGEAKEWADITRFISESVTYTKIGILKEASRILMKAGNLIAVEQYTPFVAKRFFQQIQTCEIGIPSDLTTPVATELAEVTPKSYALAHQGARAWVLSKR